MGHLVGKDVFRELGGKIDTQHVRAPWSPSLEEILRELYTEEEAALVVRMPHRLSSLRRVARITGMDGARLERLLEGLCQKGLVMDIATKGGRVYMPSPFVVGIFEYTMMRGAEPQRKKRWAELFRDYLDEGHIYRANFGNGERVSLARVVPHGGVAGDHVEVLDYEKVERIVEGAQSVAVGLCSCRHKKDHLGTRACDAPVDTCTAFNAAADFLIRRNLARPATVSEALELAARSREQGLVFCADNVKRKNAFLCHCCGCCCGVLAGLTRHGLPNAVVTSTLLAQVDEGYCTGCGRCETACPVGAIRMETTRRGDREGSVARIDTTFCLGCGVCALRCRPKALALVKRAQRVIHPETSYQRVILQCLERGTLERQLFDNPQSLTHAALRGIVGGFLRLAPVKRALMSDALRSTFLSALGAK